MGISISAQWFGCDAMAYTTYAQWTLYVKKNTLLDGNNLNYNCNSMFIIIYNKNHSRLI